MSNAKKIIAGGLGVFVALTLFLSAYTVPEGHVAIIKKFSKAVRMEDPGLHFKLPFVETATDMEVRVRKNIEKMAAATADQLPATATVSLNWTVNKTAAMDLFIRYGGLEQFESRVLDPRMRSAAKSAISMFRADQLIKERLKVIAQIQTSILAEVQGLPITASNTQLENIDLPEIYMQAILAKEKAREDAKTEQHRLAQQKLKAQQKVQTAEAEANALKAKTDGQAYQKRTLADAESYRIKTEYTGRSEGVALLAAQLTPKYNDYLRAQGWNGVLPTTILGDSGNVLFSVGAKK